MPRHHGSLADFAPDAAYADWRDEILRLTSESEATYLGWFGGDGRPLVGVLRGATLSPLPPAGPGPDRPMSWCGSDDGGPSLARALVADVLGSVVRCRACGPGNDCPECGDTGLTQVAAELAAALADEVVAHLPADGFELPAAEIATWLHRRAATAPVVLLGRSEGSPWTSPMGAVENRHAAPLRPVRSS